MAKNTPQKNMTPFEKTLTAIITLVILAVLALAVFATYGKVSENIAEQRLEDEAAAIARGEQSPNIRYMASNAGMTAEDYVAQYGLELTDGLTEESELNDMLKRMSLENYVKYNDEGAEEPTDLDALLTQWNAEELGITKDTPWGEVETKLSIGAYIGEEGFANLIEQYESYGFDMSSITADMPLKDANDAIEEIVNNGPVNPPAQADDTADAGEEVPAE